MLHTPPTPPDCDHSHACAKAHWPEGRRADSRPPCVCVVCTPHTAHIAAAHAATSLALRMQSRHSC